MKQLPYSLVEPAVSALQFCIITRARVSESGGPVICCPPPITKSQGLSTSLALNICNLINDVTDEAMATAVVTSEFVREHSRLPLIDANGFEYTAQQYTVALQNLFAALPGIISDEKE